MMLTDGLAVGVMESQCDSDVTGRNSRERVRAVTWSPGTFLFGTVLLTSQIRPHIIYVLLYFSHMYISRIKYIMYLLFTIKSTTQKKADIVHSI